MNECVLSKETRICMVYGRGSEWLLRHLAFNEVNLGGPRFVLLIVSYQKEQEYIIDFGVRI